jgi:hypothetical protein
LKTSQETPVFSKELGLWTTSYESSYLMFFQNLWELQSHTRQPEFCFMFENRWLWAFENHILIITVGGLFLFLMTTQLFWDFWFVIMQSYLWNSL